MASLDPRAFDQFLNQARIKLPGASDAGIKLELYDVMKEFFNDTGAWREDIPLVPVANTQDYLMTPTQDGGQLIRLIGVWDDKGIPIPSFMQVFGTVHLLHNPSPPVPPATWTARFVKTLTLPTTRDDVPVVPDWSLNVYSTQILDGLLGKMMGQQSKSFSNAAMAAYHLRRFRDAISVAKAAVERANGVGNQAWSYPRGWSSSTQRGGVSTAWPTRAF